MSITRSNKSTYYIRLTYAFDIKGIFKLYTILKYRDLNVLIDGAFITSWGKEFQIAAQEYYYRRIFK